MSLACELTAWMQMLSLAEHPARRWEPKRLRLRLLSAAGILTRTGDARLHLHSRGTWTQLLLGALSTLQALPAPAD